MRGRPKRESFSGVFLPTVEWEYKIEELPLRDLENDPGFGTLARNLRRRDVEPTSPRQVAGLKKAMERRRGMPGSELLVAASNGDPEAVAGLAAMGPWATCAIALGDAAWIQAKEYARLEPLCRGADRAIGESDFMLAAKHVDASPELRVYWRHGGLQRLADSASAEESLAPRLAAYLELQIACVARLRSQDEHGSHTQPLHGSFDELIDDQFASPGAALMERIRLYAGAKSVASLVEQVHLGIEILEQRDARSQEQLKVPSERTVERWFAGHNFPSATALRPLVRGIVLYRYQQIGLADLPSTARTELALVQRLFEVARRFESALKWANRFQAHGMVKSALGADDRREWIQRSFDHWKSHWQKLPASETARR